MDDLIIFFGGMAICCAALVPLAAFSDWLQKKLDEWNKQQDQQLNEQQQ